MGQRARDTEASPATQSVTAGGEENRAKTGHTGSHLASLSADLCRFSLENRPQLILSSFGAGLYQQCGEPLRAV